jgi:hypothetical protein
VDLTRTDREPEPISDPEASPEPEPDPEQARQGGKRRFKTRKIIQARAEDVLRMFKGETPTPAVKKESNKNPIGIRSESTETARPKGKARDGGNTVDDLTPGDFMLPSLSSSSAPGGLYWADRDFLVPAKDTGGQSSREWFQMMPALSQIVSVVISRDIFPYKTKGDLFRHATLRHLMWLSDLDPRMPSTLRQANIIIRAAQDSVFRSKFTEVFESVREMVRELSAMGMEEEVRVQIGAMYEELEKIPEDRWRVFYTQRFLSEFGHWVGEKERGVRKK